MAIRQPHKLLPEALVQDAVRLELEAFLERYGRAPLLLVRVAKEDTNLSTGLENLWQPSGARRPARVAPMQFTTAHDDAKAEQGKPDDFGSDLENHVYIAAILRGKGSLGGQRVSLGRAPNNGVVLRHPTVSKFHAWLEPTGEDTVQIVDPGSSNGTSVNGVRAQSRVAVEARPRDRIRFGSVETVLWSPKVLWASQNRG
jgi:hypothetical protein